jgi:hypothetical protein
MIHPKFDETNFGIGTLGAVPFGSSPYSAAARVASARTSVMA